MDTLKPYAPHQMDGEECTRSFPYTFTTEEKGALAVEANHAFQKIERAQDEKKAIVKQHDEKIQGLKNAFSLLNNKVTSGIEQRDYRCRVLLDFATGKKYYHDIITGALLGERPLDSEDYQLKADFDFNNKKNELKNESKAEPSAPLNLEEFKQALENESTATSESSVPVEGDELKSLPIEPNDNTFDELEKAKKSRRKTGKVVVPNALSEGIPDVPPADDTVSL